MNAREARDFVAENAARLLSLKKKELVDLARANKIATTPNDEKLIASAVNKLINQIAEQKDD